MRLFAVPLLGTKPTCKCKSSMDHHGERTGPNQSYPCQGLAGSEKVPRMDWRVRFSWGPSATVEVAADQRSTFGELEASNGVA